MHSSLVNYVKLSPNYTANRNHAIDTITIHCMAGNLTVESCGNLFANPDRQASSNYGIGSDGRIACYVEEEHRSWCSGGELKANGMTGRENDFRAITIEVANDGGAPDWHVSDKAIESLIKLLADVCRRNGIKQLKWENNKNLVGLIDKQNMSVHRWFARKACPGDYLMGKHPYIRDEVNKLLGTPEQSKPAESTTPQNTEKAIWDFLMGITGNSYGTAGLIGNLSWESSLKPNNLQNSFEKKLGMNDEQYTAAVDAGTYTNFVRDSAGYGLAQWTYWSRKQKLLQFAQSRGVSIGDLQMQLDFLKQELNGYAGVLKALQGANSVKEASDAVMTGFEKPQDQSEEAKAKRASLSQSYYNKYAESSQGNAQDTSQEPKPVTNKVTAAKPAQKVDKTLAGRYKSTAVLRLRNGSGTNEKILVTMPKGQEVTCYGYYNQEKNTKWLYIQFILNGVQYTGFSSADYLKKI